MSAFDRGALHHTIVNGNASNGGSCHRIASYRGNQTETKVFVDIGRMSGPGGSTTSDIHRDLATAQGLFLSHGHPDHISGVPAVVKKMREADLPVPPIYVEPMTRDILKHEFAAQGVGMEGLRLRPLAPERPVVFREDGRKLVVTPYATSHSTPTLGFVFQLQGKDRITFVLESDVKTDDSVLTRPGLAIGRLRDLCGGPIDCLAMGIMCLPKPHEYGMSDSKVVAHAQQGVKGYKNIVFVTSPGYSDFIVNDATVASRCGADALVYHGWMHGMIQGAMKKGGYDISAIASPDRPLPLINSLTYKPVAGRKVAFLMEGDPVEMGRILTGAPGALPVPLGRNTVFAFIPAINDVALIDRIEATGSAVYMPPDATSHNHAVDVIARIEALVPNALIPLHAPLPVQQILIDRLKGRFDGQLLVAPNGRQTVITIDGCAISPALRPYERLPVANSMFSVGYNPKANKQKAIGPRAGDAPVPATNIP